MLIDTALPPSQSPLDSVNSDYQLTPFLPIQMISWRWVHQPGACLTLQLSASSLSALWASIGFWMTRPPDVPEKSIATRVASDFDCTRTQK